VLIISRGPACLILLSSRVFSLDGPRACCQRFVVHPNSMQSLCQDEMDAAFTLDISRLVAEHFRFELYVVCLAYFVRCHRAALSLAASVSPVAVLTR
jgi:hypothetical protein